MALLNLPKCYFDLQLNVQHECAFHRPSTATFVRSIVAHTLLYFTQQVQSFNETDNLIGRDFVQILWQQSCSAKHRESDPLHCGTGTQNMVRCLIIFQAQATFGVFHQANPVHVMYYVLTPIKVILFSKM
ncbi:hypothetical protein NQ317_004884 [Molorchus minor]|uniref:Uncharacterized protein n=1 Tax=Molorchus minor TaxID=1323400 RepID=A0ABQ9J4E9_9CUCU|nr:hypothetical protein NQ317_004884 [Molorchus minor]